MLLHYLYSLHQDFDFRVRIFKNKKLNFTHCHFAYNSAFNFKMHGHGFSVDNYYYHHPDYHHYPLIVPERGVNEGLPPVIRIVTLRYPGSGPRIPVQLYCWL